MVECSPAGAEKPDRFHLDLTVNAYKFDADREALREPLGELVQAAVAEVEKKVPCEGAGDRG
ncbi:hypothetical protein ABZ820_24235 [Streptomyces diacarni]|uniref:hypothetical protein n=1 Tax=Streptomyces diacarni TaxID=2800381 RepID=UPI0033EEFB6A